MNFNIELDWTLKEDIGYYCRGNRYLVKAYMFINIYSYSILWKECFFFVISEDERVEDHLMLNDADALEIEGRGMIFNNLTRL